MYIVKCTSNKQFNASPVQSSIIENFLIHLNEKLTKSQASSVKLSLIKNKQTCILCTDLIQATYLYDTFSMLDTEKTWSFEMIDLNGGYF